MLRERDGAISTLRSGSDQDDCRVLWAAVAAANVRTRAERLDRQRDRFDRFAARFRNDGTGAPACDPAVLLKAVLFADWRVEDGHGLIEN